MADVSPGQEVVNAIVELATPFDCQIDFPERPADPYAPAYWVRISSPLRDRCDVTCYLDDPPTLANMSLGIGGLWWEWWSPTVAEVIEDYVWYLEQILQGRVRQRLHYLDDQHDWSTFTFLDNGVWTTGDGDATLNLVQQLLARRRAETIEYQPYPLRSEP
jgi:hypothetical protein